MYSRLHPCPQSPLPPTSGPKPSLPALTELCWALGPLGTAETPRPPLPKGYTSAWAQEPRAADGAQSQVPALPQVVPSAACPERPFKNGPDSRTWPGSPPGTGLFTPLGFLVCVRRRSSCWLCAQRPAAVSGRSQRLPKKNLRRRFLRNRGQSLSAELRSLFGLRTRHLASTVYSAVSSKPACRERENFPRAGDVPGELRSEREQRAYLG